MIQHQIKITLASDKTIRIAVLSIAKASLVIPIGSHATNENWLVSRDHTNAHDETTFTC